MKICWDNLEKLKYSERTGKWRKGTHYYFYIDNCKECNNSFLSQKLYSDFCSNRCSQKGKNNSIYTDNYSNTWKGGYSSKNIPLYDTYAKQLSFAEQVRRNKEDKNILEVKCTYCGKWHIPKRSEIKERVRALNGDSDGEQRLYCSISCKQECSIFNQKKYPKGYKKASSREVQPELRQLVFKRDKYQCIKCDSKKSLHCHHITGVEINPIESADIDNCVTLCKNCHKEVHSKDGCKTSDYKRKKCKEKML
jgi:5-methylcytosine-specific restriction endonuclease McrA